MAYPHRAMRSQVLALVLAASTALAAPLRGPRILDCKRTCDAEVAQTCGVPDGTPLSQHSFRRCERQLWRQCHRLQVTCVTTSTTTSTSSTITAPMVTTTSTHA